MPHLNSPIRTIDYIEQWLKDYHTKAGTAGWVVGVSGGIDSAVTSSLCARTGLPTLLVEMPIHQHADQVGRAQEHIRSLQAQYANVAAETVDLTGVYESLVSVLPNDSDQSNGLALANSRARIRMTALYACAAQQGALVVGTGNKVEDFGVGFYTKYGDGGVDLSPIADLMKSEVFALGKALDVVDSIQEASPTDGLWGDDRTDEDQLGATYAELEWAMHQVDSSDQNWSAREHEVMAIYRKLNQANQHKMQPIPVCVLPVDFRSTD
ncbi:MAG: NAD(+) synthase [Flavobacteriales bacterium]|nr:NAD(+) synthase [Flavobacteriales bacterium]